jgi:hypothetical protein
MTWRAIALALCCLSIACGDTTEGVRTQFVGSYPFTPTERRTIARIAGAAALDARRHLQALPHQITLQVESGADVIPELGATATAIVPDWIRWTVNPDDPRGVATIAETHLRAALFHEFHHLVRGAVLPPTTLMERVVFEGLATAFERDFAGASPPWATYPGEVGTWLDELRAQSPEADPDQWLYRHPDGRRWIGMTAGTYLVDRAMKRLNRDAAQLVVTPAAEIVEVAAPAQALRILSMALPLASSSTSLSR